LVPGIEYSDPSNTVHTLVWGDVPFLGAGTATQRLLEQATERGGVCVFAHPSRREAWKVFRQEWLKHLAGIEIWNRKTDGWSPSREAIRLVAETGAQPVVGLDFHSAKQFFPLAACLALEGAMDEKTILDALCRRAYRWKAFGMDLEVFTGPFGLSTTGFVEIGRRLAARVARGAISHLFRTTAQTAGQPQNGVSTPAHHTNVSDGGAAYQPASGARFYKSSAPDESNQGRGS
jgi:hypothetical protein